MHYVDGSWPSSVSSMAESPVHYPPAPRGCDAADARHGGQFRTGNGVESGRGVYTRLLVDDGDIQQHNFRT